MSDIMVGTERSFMNGYAAGVEDAKKQLKIAKRHARETNKTSPLTASVYEDAYTYLERKLDKLGENFK